MHNPMAMGFAFTFQFLQVSEVPTSSYDAEPDFRTNFVSDSVDVELFSSSESESDGSLNMTTAGSSSRDYIGSQHGLETESRARIKLIL